MRKIGLILLSLMVAYGLVAADKPIKCPKKVSVMTEKLAGQVFVEHVTFKGTLQSESIPVLAKTNGTVTALMVGEGDLVSEDFRMVELNGGLKEEIIAIEKDIDSWQKRLKARQNWKERNPKAEAQAEENVKLAETKLAELQQQVLESLVYIAPVSGKISDLKVALDQEVKAGDHLLSVVNAKKKITHLEMEPSVAAIFTDDSYGLAVGGQQLDAVKLGYQDGCIVLAVQDESLTIDEGTSFSLTLVKETHQDSLVIAESVILADADKHFAYVVDGEVARLRQITVLAREANKALVTSGLTLGEELIVAEIADAKKSLLKEGFPCLKEAARIVVMVKDEKKNQLVKRPKSIQAKIHKAQKQELPQEEVKPEVKQKPVSKKKKVAKEKTPDSEGAEKALRYAIGVRVGMLSTSYSYDLAAGSGYTVEPKGKQTLGFAGMFEYAITKDISLGAEVASLAKDSIFQLNVNNKSYDLESKKKYLELTIYGKYHLPVRIDKAGKLRPFLMLGFFYGQKDSGSWQYVYNDEEIITEDDSDSTWGKIDSGLVAGLGFDYAFSPAFSLLFDARYNLGFRDLKGNAVSEEVKFKGVQLNLGGLFRF